MKGIGLISTVVDWLVDKGICAGGSGVSVTDRGVKSAIHLSSDVWKTAGVFANKGELG